MTKAEDETTRVAVVLASAGRPAVLAEALHDARAQTARDVTIVLAVPDVRSLPEGPIPDKVLIAEYCRGLTKQRNSGISAVPEARYIFFFDDDAVIRDDYIAQATAFFIAHPGVVAITGRVLLDGASRVAVSRREAVDALETSAIKPSSGEWEKSRTLYGCNFAIDAAALRDLRFDERLPLYGWLEDHDFARRAMRFGNLAKVNDCVIVHRGVKSGGRVAHQRLGYAQVMHPCYLAHIKSFPLWLAIWEVFRPVAKNVVRSLVHAEQEWRRERLRGNIVAARDLLRGQISPELGLRLD